jgi:predicted nucleic acid-binding protein
VNGEAPRVYLDANVFIAAFENPGAHSDHAWWVLDAVERGRITAVTSELTLAEILIKPLETRDDALAAAYQEIIVSAPGFEVLPVTRVILIDAARLRAARSSIRLPDAVHLTTAQHGNCAFLVSDDVRLAVPERMTLLRVDPFTVDDILSSA